MPVLLGLSDTDISVADTSIPDNEVTSSISNSSASATITMYASPDESLGLAKSGLFL